MPVPCAGVQGRFSSLEAREEELCAGTSSASSAPFSLDLGFSSFLSVTRYSLAIGHSSSLYVADPAVYRA